MSVTGHAKLSPLTALCVAFIGDESASCAPAFPRNGAASMPRRHFKDRQLQPLQERLAEEAKRLREKAKSLQPGTAREETGSHLTEWLSSPGLRAPE